MKYSETLKTALTIILILLCLHNIYVYHKDNKEIKELEKEKLRLEIEHIKKGDG